MQLQSAVVIVATSLVAAACGSSTPASPTMPGDVPTDAPPVTNRAPEVTIGYVTAFTGSFELLGNVKDPEEGLLCGRQYCVSASATCACGAVTLNCSCLAGLEAFVMKTESAGVCTVTFTLKDSLGLEGQSSYSFDVSRPRGPASSRRE
jgi:hypothetical protein